MADDLCTPFESCDAIDGQLLINRTADGPAIGVELAEMAFGPVTMKGATLHPYVRWTYSQTWSTKEACIGPVRSVIGLAPGETVTIEVTHRHSVDQTKLVREAADRSNTSSRTERRPLAPPPQMAGSTSTPPDRSKLEADAQAELHQMQQQNMQYLMSPATPDDGQVELQPLHYEELGSPFLELIVGAIIGAAAGDEAHKQAEADAAIDAAAQQLEHEKLGGAGTINHDTSQLIGEIVDEVQRAESQSSVSETTTTTRDSTEQRVVRTFANPYRDRSLELRFFPIFRRFEITTTVFKAQPGVLLRPGVINFAVVNPRAVLGSFVEKNLTAKALAATALVDPGDERKGAAASRTSAVADHLSANAPLYTRRFLEHTDAVGNQDALLAPFAKLASGPARAAGHDAAQGESLASGLAWSRALVKNGEIHVPIAEPANWPAAWKQGAGAKLASAISATIGDAAWRSQWTTTRSVHIFMGTHVEAVAGTCVLEDLPPV